MILMQISLVLMIAVSVSAESGLLREAMRATTSVVSVPAPSPISLSTIGVLVACVAAMATVVALCLLSQCVVQQVSVSL